MRALILSLLIAGLQAQMPVPGRNAVTLRGQRQDIYLLRPETARARFKVLFLPGDGGWRGAAIEIGRTVADWGYDVFGLDTKHYLESFTGGRQALKETEVASDLRALAAWIRQDSRESVHLIGWSEGAGLGLLGVEGKENAGAFTGLVALGLPETAVLGWRMVDNISRLTRKTPDEPAFRSMDHLPGVVSPLLMIHSTGDEYTTVEAARKMLAAASGPKRLVLIPARNHRYDGGRDELYRALKEGLMWMERGGK